MFLNILKKDLKRGRTMNTIILLFVILSVTFIAGSVNSIVSVTSSLDNYFDKAGVPELVAGTMDKAQVFDLEEMLAEDSDLYDKIEHEEIMFFDGDQITFPDGKKTNFLNTAIVESVDTLKTKFFDE
ncbi:MAG: hypothetical protein IKR27_08780, partial [Lachnospiraceae bacterium]|nr:hypothetical protein [Lachnospiraceae bacterium]